MVEHFRIVENTALIGNTMRYTQCWSLLHCMMLQVHDDTSACTTNTRGGFIRSVTRPLRACTMLYHGKSVTVRGTMVNVGRALVEHW